MKLAILSDSHDNRNSVLNAIAQLEDLQPDRILHLGDVCAPFTMELFSGLPIDFCFGNCDWDKRELKQVAKGMKCSIDYSQELDLAGKRILACHGDNANLLNQAVSSGEFHYVFHGHTHKKRDDTFENTRVINPGALQRAAEYSFAILDLENDSLTYYPVPKE